MTIGRTRRGDGHEPRPRGRRRRAPRRRTPEWCPTGDSAYRQRGGRRPPATGRRDGPPRPQRPRRARSRRAHPSRSVQGEPAGEHRQCRQQPSLRRSQQVVAPRDRRSQRGLTGGPAATSDQHREHVVDTTGDFLDAQAGDAGRGQLDRQRKTIKSPAHRLDQQPLPRGRHEPNVDEAGTIDEQRRRLARCVAAVKGQRRDAPHLLTGDAERLSARHHDLDRRARPNSSSTTSPAASRTCSQLSSTTKHRRSPTASRSRGEHRTFVAHSPGPRASGDGHRPPARPSTMGERSVKHTPSFKSTAGLPAPTPPPNGSYRLPPAPVTVTSRDDRTSASSSPKLCRPAHERRARQRKVRRRSRRATAAAETRPPNRSRTAGTHARDVSSPSRRWRPTSTRSTPTGSRSRVSCAVTSDTTTWPPCAIPINRATRFSGDPK